MRSESANAATRPTEARVFALWRLLAHFPIVSLLGSFTRLHVARCIQARSGLPNAVALTWGVRDGVICRETEERVCELLNCEETRFRVELDPVVCEPQLGAHPQLMLDDPTLAFCFVEKAIIGHRSKRSGRRCLLASKKTTSPLLCAQGIARLKLTLRKGRTRILGMSSNVV